MAKKKNPTSLGRIGRVEREQRNIRIVRNVTIAVVAITIISVIIGSIMEFFVIPKEPVAVVNGVEITTEEYRTRVRFERGQLINIFQTYYGYYQVFQDQNLGQQLSAIAAQLESGEIALTTYQTMIDDILIAQAAEEMGIRVSEEEIDAEIYKVYNFYPEGTPTATVYPTTAPTSTLSAKQLAIITLTPTKEPIPTVTATASPTSDPEVSATPTTAKLPTLTPTMIFTPTPFTIESFQEIYATEMANLTDLADVSESDFRDIIGSKLLRQKVLDALNQDISIEQEHFWVRHIVVENEELANEVLGLIREGQDWGTLAQELSTDTFTASRGGDLGWRVYDTIIEPYAEVLIGMEIGDFSDPIEFEDPSLESGTSWAIIQLLGKETRNVDPFVLSNLQQSNFANWLESLRAEADIVESEDWFDKAPDDPQLVLPSSQISQ